MLSMSTSPSSSSVSSSDSSSSSSSSSHSSNAAVYHLHVPIDQIDVGRFIFFSALSSFGEAVIYYPFDLIRTRLQVTREPFSLQGFSLTVKQLGFQGLYRGFWSQLGGLPSYIFYMWSYSYTRDRLQAYHDARARVPNVANKTTPWVAFVAGALADVVSNFLLCPAEVVMQRLQISELSQKRYNGGIDATRHIFREEGIRGFYRGLGATLLTYAPGSAIWWMTYEHYKEVFSMWMSRDSEEVTQHVPAQLLAGFVAGGITVVVTNPMDVIKTRLQTQHAQYVQIRHDLPMQASTASSTVLYKNSWDAFTRMMANEGVSAFRKGLVPRLVTSAVMSPIFSLVYEIIMELSKKKQDA